MINKIINKEIGNNIISSNNPNTLDALFKVSIENINITEEEMDDDSQAKTELLDINSSLGLVDEILPIPKPNV